jgi:hypothetical protein
MKGLENTISEIEHVPDIAMPKWIGKDYLRYKTNKNKKWIRVCFSMSTLNYY